MKNVWTKGLVVLAAALSLAACGQKAGHGAKPAGKLGELHLYNWSDFIDPKILTGFTHEAKIPVVYDTFDSNEVLETRMLQGHTGYDLVVPSNHNVPRYIAAGAIQPLDKSKLKGLNNLDPRIMAYMSPFDPSNAHTVPYMWGTIGIGYNPDAVAKRLPGVNIDSWAFAFDPENLAKLKDCGVYWLDASEDMYAVALRYMGKDPNSKSVADYQAATEMMLKARPYVRKLHSSEYINALAGGGACLVIGYSGDVLQAKARAAEAHSKTLISYVVPKEGAQVWFDVFAIPKDAPNPEAAYRFLNYILRPDIIAKASNFTHYANANAAATSSVDSAIRSDANVYPPPAVFNRLFVTTTKDQALLREVNRQWTRVQTGQ